MQTIPNSKVHGANMGSIWGRQDPGGPHVGPMNVAIWDITLYQILLWWAPTASEIVLCNHIWYINLKTTEIFLYSHLFVYRQGHSRLSKIWSSTKYIILPLKSTDLQVLLSQWRPVSLRCSSRIQMKWGQYHTLPGWGRKWLVKMRIPHINGLVQERRYSSASAIELRFPCTMPFTCHCSLYAINI